VAQEAETGEARMCVGRRAEEMAQLGRRGVLERRRYCARVVAPTADEAASQNPDEPTEDPSRRSATSQCPDSAGPAALLVCCASASIRRQSSAFRGSAPPITQASGPTAIQSSAISIPTALMTKEPGGQS
jgi:hypothetical protein